MSIQVLESSHLSLEERKWTYSCLKRLQMICGMNEYMMKMAKHNQNMTQDLSSTAAGMRKTTFSWVSRVMEKDLSSFSACWGFQSVRMSTLYTNFYLGHPSKGAGSSPGQGALLGAAGSIVTIPRNCSFCCCLCIGHRSQPVLQWGSLGGTAFSQETTLKHFSVCARLRMCLCKWRY